MKNRMEIRTDRLLITEFDEIMVESVHLNSQDEETRRFVPAIMDQLKIEHIYGICHGENIPSQRVLEKTGFTLECREMASYQGKTQEIVKYKYSL